jgi:integrase
MPMGSVFTRHQTLRWYVRYKDTAGKWRQDPTDYHGPDEEHLARRTLSLVEERIAAKTAVSASGPLTVARWVEKWEATRKAQTSDWNNEHQRLRDHVLPVIGHIDLDRVRPRHVVEVVDRLRAAGKAPKTVRHVYGAIRALFRAAQLRDLVTASPCILTRHELGELEDKRPGWRPTAVYERAELEQLISDERIPWDRRVLYALEGLGGLRHGEAAGLRWRHYDSSTRPLGRLSVVTSYDTGRTKTSRSRYTPAHPVLAAMLAEWKLVGWAEMIGRSPTIDDLIVPLPAGLRTRAGQMRDKDRSFKRLKADLELLGLRHRRGHDLRRTMISLARMDGARKDLLELCTHTPRRDAAIDLYTTIEWPSLCAEISKLRIARLGRVIAKLAPPCSVV